MKNLWNGMSIKTKLLLATLFVFFLFSIILLFGQITFFESYYTHIKTGEVKKAVTEFSSTKFDDKDRLRSEMAEVSDKYDCFMMVIDKSGAIKHMLSYEMTVKTPEGSEIRFSLDNVVNSKVFSEMQLGVGDEVEVEFFGSRNDSHLQMFFPVKISTEGKEVWMLRPDNREIPPHEIPHAQKRGYHDSIKGKITRIVLPSENTRNINSERAVAAKAAMDMVSNYDNVSYSELYADYYTDEDTSEKFSVVVKADSETDELIFAIAPLNMVTEAVVVASRMYYLFFGLSMVTACVLGIIFARSVTKPIIEMTNVTKSMAALDFTKKCNYKSNDEIGELSDNINMLSSALDTAIIKLQGANEKLKEDIERERIIEKTRREFVATVSHELKTPLGIIRAYTEALTDGISENKRKHYYDVIVGETEKMDNLILDMLDNSKYETGVEKPVLIKVDLSLLTKTVLKRFSELFNKKEIVVETDIKELVTCSADADMIERVISNFVANAIFHTQQGGRIGVTVSGDDKEAVFEIENTGKSISDDDIEYIWDRFYKADKSRNRSNGGTGLGLSIAKNILNLHKAVYGAENTDEGVKFFFKISDNI